MMGPSALISIIRAYFRESLESPNDPTPYFPFLYRYRQEVLGKTADPSRHRHKKSGSHLTSTKRLELKLYMNFATLGLQQAGVKTGIRSFTGVPDRNMTLSMPHLGHLIIPFSGETTLAA